MLLRDAHQCQACKRVVQGPDAHIDHIHDDAHDPDSNRLERLQTLCAQGHSRKTAAEAIGLKWDGRCSSSVGVDADGWPIR